MATWKGRLMAVTNDPSADTSVTITIQWEHPDARRFTENYHLMRATYPTLASVRNMLNGVADAYDLSDQTRVTMTAQIGNVVTT